MRWRSAPTVSWSDDGRIFSTASSRTASASSEDTYLVSWSTLPSDANRTSAAFPHDFLCVMEYLAAVKVIVRLVDVVASRVVDDVPVSERGKGAQQFSFYLFYGNVARKLFLFFTTNKNGKSIFSHHFGRKGGRPVEPLRIRKRGLSDLSHSLPKSNSPY